MLDPILLAATATAAQRNLWVFTPSPVHFGEWDFTARASLDRPVHRAVQTADTRPPLLLGAEATGDGHLVELLGPALQGDLQTTLEAVPGAMGAASAAAAACTALSRGPRAVTGPPTRPTAGKGPTPHAPAVVGYAADGANAPALANLPGGVGRA